MQAIDCEARKQDLILEASDNADVIASIGTDWVDRSYRDRWLDLLDKHKQAVALAIECAYQLGLNDRGEG